MEYLEWMGMPMTVTFAVTPDDNVWKVIRDLHTRTKLERVPFQCAIAASAPVPNRIRVDHNGEYGYIRWSEPRLGRFERALTKAELKVAIDFDNHIFPKRKLVIVLDPEAASLVQKAKPANLTREREGVNPTSGCRSNRAGNSQRAALIRLKEATEPEVIA
jgi:hypothetical protein